MATKETPRLSMPYPSENDRTIWYPKLETFFEQLDTRIFANLENLKPVFNMLPRVTHTVDGILHYLTQNGVFSMISRTYGTEITVLDNQASPLQIFQNSMLGVRLTAGAVDSQVSEWEVIRNGADVDAEVQIFGYINENWDIYWYNGTILSPLENKRLFAQDIEGGGGGGDGKILVTGADSISGYLSTKLVPGNNVVLTVLPPDLNGETLKIDANFPYETLVGNINPNGFVTGIIGQSYFDSVLQIFYKNIDNSTSWMVI